MSADTLRSLADRCEAATGPDQDALLQEAWGLLFPKPDREDEPEWSGVSGTLREPLFHDWKVRQLAFQALLSAKGYLDAAMTLVPEGWVIGSVAEEAPRTQWVVELRRGHRTSYDKVVFSDYTPGKRAASLPLALCAAALRARAESVSK